MRGDPPKDADLPKDGDPPEDSAQAADFGTISSITPGSPLLMTTTTIRLEWPLWGNQMAYSVESATIQSQLPPVRITLDIEFG